MHIVGSTDISCAYFCKLGIQSSEIKHENPHRDNSVGIATRSGLDGPGIEFRWGQDFPHPSRQALGFTQLPIERVPGLSRG